MRYTNKQTIFRSLAVAGPILLLLMVLLSTATAQTLVSIWTELSPIGTPPVARAQAGNAYDETNDRLILFSGASTTPFPNDVWVLTNATGGGGIPGWQQLFPSGGPPQGRNQHTVVYDPISNRIIVHGGCGGFCSPALPEVWVLTNANGLGGTPNWIALPPAPIGRVGHVAAYDPGSNRMIVFGGHTAFPNTDRNDVWILTDANGIGSPAWTQLFPAGSPPPPRGEPASGAYDTASNRLIIFGGRTSVGVPFNDVWVLSNANGLGGTPEWTQLFPTGTPPSPRGGHSMIYDAANNSLIVFGGYNDATDSFFNDIWILTEANGTGGTPQWIQLSSYGNAPAPRFLHSAAYSAASKRMVVAGGTDGGVGPNFFDDVWLWQINQPPTPLTINPISNTHTAPATTAVSITYDKAIDETTVSPQTFAVHAMQTGLLLQAHSVNGGTITLTPTQPFKPGELVQVSATTGTLNLSGQGPASPTVWQFRTAVGGDGSGEFRNTGQNMYNNDAPTSDAALGDLDGDGDLDAFMARGGNAGNRSNQVWLNDGTGFFTNSGQSLGLSASWAVALGDVDSDGDLDAFVGNGNFFAGQANKVWLNDGTGNFSDSGQSLGSLSSYTVILADLDGDGDLDAFVANYPGNQPDKVWLNDGTGFFTDSSQNLLGGYGVGEQIWGTWMVMGI